MLKVRRVVVGKQEEMNCELVEFQKVIDKKFKIIRVMKIKLESL